MTAVVFPQEAVFEYAKRLFQIAGLAARDAATLTRQAASLMNDRNHGRVMGSLRKYAVEREQFGADEILEIVANMEKFVNPDDLKRKKRAQAETDAQREEWRAREETRQKAAWEPGGEYWTEARDQMVADAHALICATKVIADSGDARLVRAMREYCESEERDRLFDQLSDNLKPPPKASPTPSKRRSRRPRVQDDNVVEGPWAS